MVQYRFVAKGMSCLISSMNVGHVVNVRNGHNSNDSMSTKRKRSVLSIKDKQIIISCLDKGEKGTNLAVEFGISKQQISDIRKNKDKILKFTDNIETSEGLKRKSLKLANDERLDQALYTWFIQQRSAGTPISGLFLLEKEEHLKCAIFISFVYIVISLIFIFSIIRTLDYPDYLPRSRRVRIIEVRLYMFTCITDCFYSNL